MSPTSSRTGVAHEGCRPPDCVGADGLTSRHDVPSGQPGTVVLDEGGSFAAAKAKAAKVVEATYTVPYLAHARMEPGNATAMVTPGRVDVWTGDQAPDRALLRAAEQAGVPPEQVFVHTHSSAGATVTDEAGETVAEVRAIRRILH